jgi:hypothetical protein
MAGLVKPTDEEQEWEAHLAQLARGLNQRQWEIADAIIEAKVEWGDKYTAAVRITGKNEKTLRKWVTVARKFESSRRRDNLTFGHHAVVASKKPDDQEKWLTKADKKGWTVDDLRREISESTDRPEMDAPERIVVMVPRGTYPAFIDAVEVRGQAEAEMKKAVANWLLGLGEREVAS